MKVDHLGRAVSSIYMFKENTKMKIFLIRILLAVLLSIFSQACTQDTELKTKQVIQESVKFLAASELPSAKNGYYELADILAWAMPASDSSSPLSLSSSPQDYNRFKGVVSNFIMSKSVRYEGSILVNVEGNQANAENILNENSWAVRLDGPNIGASEFQLDSGAISFDASKNEDIDTGPAYLRKKGFELTNLVCFSDGNTPTNAEAMYLAKYPGRQPTLIKYSISTGSSGKYVNWTIYFFGISWKSVPGATERNFEGKIQSFGDCPYKEFI